MPLEDLSIHAFIQKYRICNEVGLPIDFYDHPFLFDVYRDFSPELVVMKAAQVGMTTAEAIKVLWGVKKLRLDAIYTLPTDTDVNTMVGSKINRIIAQNPIFQEWTKDKDSIEQKQIGDNFLHFRGTWTQKAAMMIPSDWNLYDEVDASKQEVIEQYATRLQHSKYRYEHYFSHPSSEGTGVHIPWEKSDQKHWFVSCPSCLYEQYLSWPDSVDMERRMFVCKECQAEITDEARRRGRWVKKYKSRKVSGYWIPLLICPWVSASRIIDYYNDKPEEYFVTKVLGLPYVGGGNKLTKTNLLKNLTQENLWPKKDERLVIGVDTGAKIHLVAGGEYGLCHYSEDSDYDELERLLKTYPRAIAVIDQGGDITRPRELRERYPGRIFLCAYKEAEGKTLQLIKWGEKDETGAVQADRNRLIQLVVDEFTEGRIPLQGSENDWYDYWLHWNALTRIKEETDRGVVRKIWKRNSADHLAHATVYWRIGISRFNGTGKLLKPEDENIHDVTKAPIINPNNTVVADPHLFFKTKKQHDWRIA